MTTFRSPTGTVDQPDLEGQVGVDLLDLSLPESDAVRQSIPVRGPGSNSRKKSASCSSKDRSPFGTILIGRWSESDCLDVSGGGADSRVDPGGVLGNRRGNRRDRACCGLEEHAQVFRHVLGGAVPL